MDTVEHGVPVWNPPAPTDILRWPLPHKGFGDRFLLKSVALVVRRQVGAIYGLDYLPRGSSPFILVANHSTRRDAVVMPAFLMLYRGGELIHFLADWNFQLIPGVAWVYRRAGAIVVGRKPARPQVLNVFKKYYVDSVLPIERARQHLAAGRPVGLFPEGTVNRRPVLLGGRNGAARLSLETGAPIIPIGLRFPQADPPNLGVGPMHIHIGPPRSPPRIDTKIAPLRAVREWHASLMTEIARLSGKAWKPHQGELK